MLSKRGTRAELHVYQNDYARLLVESGEQPSIPNAIDWRGRKGSYAHYVSIGGLLPDPFGHDETE